MDVDWKADLDRWLAPFVAALRHKTRARMCPLYVAGLIGPGDRKSVQPMAARAGEVGYDQLHHFVAAGVWPSTGRTRVKPRAASSDAPSGERAPVWQTAAVGLVGSSIERSAVCSRR